MQKIFKKSATARLTMVNLVVIHKSNITWPVPVKDLLVRKNHYFKYFSYNFDVFDGIIDGKNSTVFRSFCLPFLPEVIQRKE